MDGIDAIAGWRKKETNVFQFQVGTENGNLMLSAPHHAPRTIEIVTEGVLTTFGSTLQRESDGNRLTIDAQVQQLPVTRNFVKRSL